MKKINLLGLTMIPLLPVPMLTSLVSCGKTYTISIYTEGNYNTPSSTKKVKSGNTINLPTISTSLDGFNFVMWYTEKPDSQGNWNEEKRFWKGAAKSNLSVYARYDKGFNGVAWLYAIEAIHNFEAKTEPSVDDALTLCKALKVDNPVAKATAKETLQHNLVGIEGTVVINHRIHKVKCIDAMHDICSDTGLPAALTFELFTILTEAGGETVRTSYNSQDAQDKIHNRYENSILRKNLNDSGEGERSFTSSVLDMLPEILKIAIQKVQKQIAVPSGSDTWTSADYVDKLFPLTCTEMNAIPTDWKNPEAGQEGTVYKYWENVTDPTQRIKECTTGEHNYGYFLATPCAIKNDSNEFAWISMISADGKVAKTVVSDEDMNTTFAFCI